MKQDIAKLSKMKDEEMATMQFKCEKIEFFPEDMRKAENMSREEKMDFFKKLREEHRYIEVKE